MANKVDTERQSVSWASEAEAGVLPGLVTGQDCIVRTTGNGAGGPGISAVFGITGRDRDWLGRFFREWVGISPVIVGQPGEESCFYYANHGEVKQTGASTYLKLGFLRSPGGEPLLIDDSTDRKLDAEGFQIGSMSGNGYLVRFRRLEPGFAIFPTFMATSRIYYTQWEGGILCATDLRVLLKLVGEVSLNDEALPLHLMCRITPGPMTHFKGIFRVFPGEILDWRDGSLRIRYLKDMFCPPARPLWDRLDGTQTEEYFDGLSRIMGSYAREIQRAKGGMANELSGGVDSTLIQLLIAQHIPKGEVPRSFSLTFEATGFQFEVGYARLASEVLHTDHTFLEVRDRDYIGLLVRAIETLAQPNIKAENDPGQLALAEHVAANCPEMRVMAGVGSDALHGIDPDNVELAVSSNWRRRLPGHYALTEFVRLFGIPLSRKKLGGLPTALRYGLMPATYRCLRTPAEFLDPVNRAAVPYTTFETLRHFLGDRVMLDALEYRRSLTERVLTSHSVLERMHDIHTLANFYETTATFETLFSSAGVVLIPFYFDQDVIRLVKSVSPDVRYLRGRELKPIPKDIVRQRSVGQVIHKKKGTSGFWRDFQSSMMTGSLQEMVHAIERPGFIRRKDFDRLIGNKHPYGHDLVFPLLTYDIFKKNTARERRSGGQAA